VQDFLALKEQKALAAKVEVMTMREVADQQARDAQEAQDRKMAAIRERAMGNQTFLRTQMDVSWMGGRRQCPRIKSLHLVGL
jgi:hypothetical protein